MKNYDTILFDLDGTLVDTGLGITNSVMYALEKFGIEVTDRASLYKFIGPPLHKSFENFCGFTPEKAMQAVEFYREYYKDKGIFEVEMYAGLETTLEKLYNAGKTLLVTTSKPEVFAKKILEHLGIEKYFKVIAGSNLDGTRTVKAEVISYALEQCNITDLSTVIIVGDREYDIIGANEIGIDSMGVLFGYGSEDELKNAGATYLAKSTADIYNQLCLS